MTDDIHYRILKYIEENPDTSQRELARALGVSLGKVNYCVRALVDKGWVKVRNFRNSDNKLAYAYVLTPKGINQKAVITVNFLKRKMAEYETIKKEIEQLRREVSGTAD